MKTVSREKAQELKDAEWVKETHWVWYKAKYETWWSKYGIDWVLIPKHECPGDDWLPAPTLDEVLEELRYSDFVDLYSGSHNITISYTNYLQELSKWLYTTMCSADAAADVWRKTHQTGGAAQS